MGILPASYMQAIKRRQIMPNVYAISIVAYLLLLP